MPASEYWANNKDNTFRKDNAGYGMMRDQRQTFENRCTTRSEHSKSDASTGKSEPKHGTFSKQYAVSRQSGGDCTDYGCRSFSSNGKNAVRTGNCAGYGYGSRHAGFHAAIYGKHASSGFLCNIAMAQTPSSFTDQESGTSVQARCGRVSDLGYIQGYLRTQIGRQVKIEFLIGSNMFVDREGYLVDVGIDYLIINEINTDDLLLCDMYSIKFVKIYF